MTAPVSYQAATGTLEAFPIRSYEDMHEATVWVNNNGGEMVFSSPIGEVYARLRCGVIARKVRVGDMVFRLADSDRFGSCNIGPFHMLATPLEGPTTP